MLPSVEIKDAAAEQAAKGTAWSKSVPGQTNFAERQGLGDIAELLRFDDEDEGGEEE